MEQKSLLEVLEAELPNIECQVIREIIDLRTIDQRASQKTISEQFDVPRKAVKKIFDRMKDWTATDSKICTGNKDGDGEKDNMSSVEDNAHDKMGDDDMNVSQSSVTTDFSSMDELKQFVTGLGNLQDETSSGQTQALRPTEILIDTEYQAMTTEELDNVVNGGNKRLSEGDKLINHVKWYVGTASEEISSLRGDQELFEAEKNSLNEQIYNLRVAEREKDKEIDALTAELKAANALRKSVLCSRCNEPKKYGVAGMNFCGIACIRKAFIDLRGADELFNT